VDYAVRIRQLALYELRCLVSLGGRKFSGIELKFLLQAEILVCCAVAV
jgi:hypothetical protein